MLRRTAGCARPEEAKEGKWGSVEKKETDEDSKGLITAYHRGYNVYLNSSPVRSPHWRRKIVEIKGQLAPRPSHRRTQEGMLRCRPRWLRRRLVHLLLKEKGSHFRHSTGPKLPGTPCNPRQQTRYIQEACRNAARHKCTSGCWGFDFLFLYLFTFMKNFLKRRVKRSAEDESVMLYRKHSSAW